MSDHDDHGNLGLICNHVLRNDRPLKQVLHHSDDTWDFMCGEDDHYDPETEASVICVNCAMEGLSPQLRKQDVPIDFIAEKPEFGSRWVIRRMTDDERLEEENT